MASSLSRPALNLVVWIHLLFILKQRTWATSPSQTVLLNEPLTISLTLPDTDDVNSDNIARIAIDKHDNALLPTDVLYIYIKTLTFKSHANFSSIMTVVSSNRTFSLQFEAATRDIAGTFKCYRGTSSLYSYPGCQELIIILIKPEKPTLVSLNEGDLHVDDYLELMCETKSASLPPDHNLGQLVTWQLPGTIDEPQGSRMTTTQQGHLLFANLAREDNGLGFSCKCVENVTTVTAPESDPSEPYYIVLYERGNTSDEIPFKSSSSITSPVQDGSVFRTTWGQVMRYTCHFVCTPVCYISWGFASRLSGNEERLIFQTIADLATPEELLLNVTETSEGAYRCTATSETGSALLTFYAHLLT